MIFNQCLESGIFPAGWKEARLMLIRKPGKPLQIPSSYRPLSLINTVAKLFERVIKKRLVAHLESLPGGLSCHQYGFRKGRSTLDALEAVDAVVQRVGSGSLASRDLCTLVAIDVANAFNSAPWSKIDAALGKKSVPGYLRNIIRAYLSNRHLLTDMGSMPVTCGVPQGSVIGPLRWNIFYDKLLCLDLPFGVQLVGFADDLAIIGTDHTTDLLEEAMNPALEIVLRWVNANGSPLRGPIGNQTFGYRVHVWSCVTTYAIWVWSLAPHLDLGHILCWRAGKLQELRLPFHGLCQT